ncbi:MAG: hypothetical protein AAGC46_13625 [Solirubrobacteraceae bacterium]|nr:hypothetical protein [Patulibacter sp.]
MSPIASDTPSPAAATLRARRNPFTGRVSYVDPSSARGLRARVPRPLLALASCLALAAGIAFAAGAPSRAPDPAVVATPDSAVPLMAPVADANAGSGSPAGTRHR